MTAVRVCLLLLLGFVCYTAAQTPAAASFDVHQLHNLNRLGTFDASSSGGILAFDFSHWDESTRVKKTTLQIQFPNGTTYALTNPAKGSDFAPYFSPDGQYVAFLSTRSGSVQAWAIPTSGSEADVRQITYYPVDISNLKWACTAPCGNNGFLVFSAQVYVYCTPGDLSCTANIDAAVASRGPNTGFIYDELFVRHWDTWETPNKVSHLFVQPITNSNGVWQLASSSPVDLLPKMKSNTPVPPFGGSEQYDIDPAGKEIAFTAALYDREQAWTTGWRTYTVPILNGGQSAGSLVDCSAFTQARTTNPAYSPDGKTLAFLAMDRPGYESDRLHMVLMDRSSGTFSTLADSWDRSITGLAWSLDSKRIFVDADDDGYHKIFLLTVGSQNVQELVSTGDNVNLMVTAAGIFYNRNSLKTPSDIWKFQWFGSRPSTPLQLTNLNSQFTSTVSPTMPTPISFTFTSTGNVTIQAWFIPPFNWSPMLSRSFPLALLIHGGPEGAWNDGWSFRWNPMLFAARGYAVLTVNPRGSTGFGQNYTDGVNLNWGGVPFDDIMNGVKYVLSNNSWVDGQKVCAAGASYGGYMINWLQSQTSNFQCLVNHDGVFDIRTMFYSTEELWFPIWEYGGVPWSNPKGYEQWNPARFVGNWQTPTLVVHGGRDYRIPISQGLSTFTALQYNNIPSKLLYFPEENHWVLNPANSILWYDTVLGWLDRWTQNPAAPPRSGKAISNKAVVRGE